MQYCAVCLIARDENKYILEWAEYHLRIGFDTLLVYDNNSVVPLRETLAGLVELGRVVVHDIEDHPEGWLETQATAYADCMSRYGDVFKWIAFIDADEFIFPKKTRNIKEFLAEYECYGAVVAHWLMFGSSGLERNETNSQLFSFIHADQRPSTTIKSIVQPKKAIRFRGPHGADLKPGFFAVSSDHFPLEPCVYAAPVVDDAIQLNHYWFRSWEDRNAKAARKAINNRPLSSPSVEEERARFSHKTIDILKYYTSIQDEPITRYSPVAVPETVHDMVAAAMDLLDAGKTRELELFLCQASLMFEDEPLIWMLRSVSARLQKNPARALHCIKEAAKNSGASTIYFELSRVYAMLGDTVKAERALVQANYKKHVEDATCAPVRTPMHEHASNTPVSKAYMRSMPQSTDISVPTPQRVPEQAQRQDNHVSKSPMVQ